MKVSVFYFSGTGNTKWAVEEVSKCIVNKGHECFVHSIEDTVPDLRETLQNTDIIGFAFPIYGANMPNIMLGFFRKLAQVSGQKLTKPAFIITTAGYIDAFGPICANEVLKECGFKLLSYINLKLSNNLSTPKIKASIKSGESLGKRIERNKLVIDKAVDHIVTMRRHIQNIGPYLISGYFIRRAAEKGQKNCYLSLSINKDLCRKCMLCVKSCPTKSIVYENDNFTFLPTCTACMRCYNWCPVSAVYHLGKYADPKTYKRYRGPHA